MMPKESKGHLDGVLINFFSKFDLLYYVTVPTFLSSYIHSLFIRHIKGRWLSKICQKKKKKKKDRLLTVVPPDGELRRGAHAVQDASVGDGQVKREGVRIGRAAHLLHLDATAVIHDVVVDGEAVTMSHQLLDNVPRSIELKEVKVKLFRGVR